MNVNNRQRGVDCQSAWIAKGCQDALHLQQCNQPGVTPWLLFWSAAIYRRFLSVLRPAAVSFIPSTENGNELPHSKMFQSGDESPHSKATGWIIALAACCLLMIFGCGGPAKPNYPTLKLAGAVKVDGVAVEQGRIRFSPTKPDQAPAAEDLIAAGQYSVDKAPIGSVVVTLTGVKTTGRLVEVMGQKIEESVNVIPAKYSRGLPVTIDAAGNRDFDLTSQ